MPGVPRPGGFELARIHYGLGAEAPAGSHLHGAARVDVIHAAELDVAPALALTHAGSVQASTRVVPGPV